MSDSHRSPSGIAYTVAADTPLDRFKAATAKIAAKPRPASLSGRPRLVFALDATASRQPTWDLACSLVGAMFDAAGAVGGLDMQLVYFRGETSCVAGPWVANTKRLTPVMTGIQCRAGQTQIGKVLDHIAREEARQQVAAFVYIGDAVEEDGLIAKAATLRAKGFVFHENPRANPGAVETLHAIADRTGGVYLPFDESSARQLGGLLAGVAAWAAGGQAALARRDDAGSRLLLEKLNQPQGGTR